MDGQTLRYITPAVTPLTPGGQIDLDSCQSLYRYLLSDGMDGILVLGSIGEFFGFTLEQKKALLRCACQTVGGSAHLIAGVTSMVYDEIVDLSAYALDQGADAVMIIPPYYFCYTDEGVFHYFDQLAGAIPGSIYIYNFPERTGYDVSPAVIRALAERHPNIIGVKDTVGKVDHTREIIKQVRPVRPDFVVFSGYDDNFAHTALSGGSGGISGLSNLFPGLFSAWVRALREGDMAQVARLQQQVDAMMDIYAITTPFIPTIKEGLVQLGVIACAAPTRPMQPLTDEQKTRLARLLASCPLR